MTDHRLSTYSDQDAFAQVAEVAATAVWENSLAELFDDLKAETGRILRLVEPAAA